MARKKKLGRLVDEGPLDLGKLDLGLRRVVDRRPDEEIDVIIRVATADYLPAGIRLRGRISAKLLTARTSVRDLPRLVRDPQVLSVAESEPLPLVPPKAERADTD